MKKQTQHKATAKKQPRVDISSAKDKEEKHDHKHGDGARDHDHEHGGILAKIPN